MRTWILPSLLLWLPLCGCRTISTGLDTSPGSSGSPKAPVPDSLASTGSTGILVVEERSSEFYQGKPRAISGNAFRPRVDYKSELRISADKVQLLKEVTTDRSFLEKLTPDQKGRLDQLGQFVQAARDYLTTRAAAVRAYDQIRSRELTEQDQVQLLALGQKEARTATNLLGSLLSYARAKVRDENPTLTGINLINARDALVIPFVSVHPGQAMGVNIFKLSDFVAVESAELVRQLTRDAQVVRTTGAFLRMRATLWPAGTPLHILNYDTFSDSNVVQEERVSFKMSAEDRERIAAETKVNSEIAQLIRDAQNGQSAIRQSFDSLIAALRGDLTSWKAAVTNLSSLEQKLATVVAALDKAHGSLRLAEAQKKLVDDAKKALVEAGRDLGQLRASINLIVGNSNPGSDPAESLLTTVDGLSGALDRIVTAPQTIASRVSQIYEDLQRLVIEIGAAIRDDSLNLQDLANVLQAGAPASFGEVKKLLEICVSNYPNLVAEFRSLRNKAQISSMASKLEPIQTDPNLLDTDVLTPPDGFISLAKNVVRGDVIVQLDAALVTRNEGGTVSSVKSIDHREFEVEKLGLINKWSANLILVNRLGDLDPNERDVQFSPAPSISWTLHYNPPPKVGADYRPPNKLWETIFPGIGLNVAALNWNNGVQFGMGGHLSLLNNLLTIGGGWNLNESRHGGYVFVGLGLLESLNKLGLTGDSVPHGR